MRRRGGERERERGKVIGREVVCYLLFEASQLLSKYCNEGLN